MLFYSIVQTTTNSRLTVTAFFSQACLRPVSGHLSPSPTPTPTWGGIEVFIGGNVTGLELVGRRVTCRRVDGGPAPPQGVEPGDEGGVVFEAAG